MHESRTIIRRHTFAGTMLSLAFVITIFLTPVFAQQEKAAVTGIVADSTGAAIAGARIVATGTATGVETPTVTNSSGYYYLSLLPGDYTLSVSQTGFATARVERFTLSVNQTATINVPLQVGSAQEEVTVTALAPLLEQQTASLGTTIESQKILELPILGRNPYTLVELAPGVTPRGNPGTGAIISGGRSNANAFLLDGGQVLNSTTNDTSYTPPLESVGEFKVQTNSFSAEFGRTSGGVINATTRRGTDRYRGSLYEFLRNDAFNANSYTRNLRGLEREVLKRNEFGGTIGGPLQLPLLYRQHDKTFFFTNLEKIIQRTPQTIIATVPTELERRGDFSRTFFAEGRTIPIFDPLTTVPNPNRPGSFIRTAFPGNVIPASRISPLATRILEFFPLPNRPGDPGTGRNNFARTGAESRDSTRLLARVDHVFNDKNSLFVRYGFNQENQTSNILVNEAFPRQTSTSIEPVFNRGNTVLATDTHVFSPALIAEFRVGFTRNRRDSSPTSLGFDLASLGFVPSLAQGVSTNIFPQFNFSEVEGLGPDNNAVRFVKQENYQAQTNLILVRGTQTIKTGFDLEVFRNHAFAPSRPSGQFGFTRGFTQADPNATSTVSSGSSFASFLLGLPASGAVTIDPAISTQQTYYAAYVQDTFQVRRGLSLDLGLRYEYTQPWNERFNRLAYFNPTATETTTGRRGTLEFLSENQRLQTTPDRNNFGPRFGLAWEFIERTVLRAGYGLFFTQGNGGVGAVASELGGGFQTTTSLFLGEPDAIQGRPPAGSLLNPFSTGLRQAPSTLLGENIRTTTRDFITPYNHQWTASLQRQVTQDLLIEVAYSGSRGLRLWRDLELNALDAGYLSLGSALRAQVPNPFFGQIATGVLSARTVERFRLLLPYPQYGNITQFRAQVGDSIYHALTVKVDKRFSHGFSVLGSYTNSKSIDNVTERFSGRSSTSNVNDLSRDRSVSESDVAQRLVVSYIFDLPFGAGRRFASDGVLAKIIGGFQFSGITVFQSGLPIVITVPNAAAFPGLNSRAVRLRSGRLSEGQTRDRYFDTSAFARPDAFTLGNDSRTQPDLRALGLRSFNILLARNFRFTEGTRLQLRGEVFNLFNTPQLDSPVSNIDSPDFGRILSGDNPRVIQLGLRFTF